LPFRLPLPAALPAACCLPPYLPPFNPAARARQPCCRRSTLPRASMAPPLLEKLTIIGLQRFDLSIIGLQMLVSSK